jgi:DNA-binding transcriptional MerR regulator
VTVLLSLGAAAQRLATTPRMLRYREALGLLPAPQAQPGAHRRYGAAELAAARRAMQLEQRYGIGPQALAFGLRALSEPAVAADLHELARLTGRLPREPLAALDFEKQKAERLLAVRRRTRTGFP